MSLWLHALVDGRYLPNSPRESDEGMQLPCCFENQPSAAEAYHGHAASTVELTVEHALGRQGSTVTRRSDGRVLTTRAVLNNINNNFMAHLHQSAGQTSSDKALKTQGHFTADLVSLDFSSDSLQKFLENVVQIVNQHSYKLNRLETDKLNV